MSRKRAENRPEWTVEITRLSPQGDGVGTVEEHEVVVPGLLPGERARVRCQHRSPHKPRPGQARRVYATLVELLEPHEARRPPPCRHHEQCSGCPLMGATEDYQRELKQALVGELLDVPTERLVASPSQELGYRWSAKRVVGGRQGAIVLGSYRRGSHQLVDMRDCLVDHPDIGATAREVADQASQLGLRPYCESTGEGQLRYVWFKTDGQGQVLVCLVMASRQDASAAAELAGLLPSAAGVSWCALPADGNALRGDETEQLAGCSKLTIELAGEPRAVGPLGFLQPNPKVAALAAHHLVAGPPGRPHEGRVALDLYAGSGLTTALLRRRFAIVVPCEAYPESARALGVDPETAEQLLDRLLTPAGDDLTRAARPLPRPTEVDLVIANPPRAGLGERVCEQLDALRSKSLGLMSCRPSSLARDLARLTGPEGSYELLHSRGYDTLPQTTHVEMVAWLGLRDDGE